MSFVLMFIYSPLLCLVACLVLSIYVLCMTYCQMRWGHIASMTKTSMASLTALTAQYVSTISQMKAQCLEHVYLQKWQQTLTEYLHAHRQYSLMNNMEQIFSFFIFSMGYLSILAVGVYGVCKHWMTVGEMMACHVLFLSLHDAVSQQFRLGHQYRQIEADVQYIADITDHPVDLIPPFAAGAGAPSNGKHGLGKIQLIDVTFGYSHAFKPLFSHFNMTIEAGSNVAIVGPSGSGKSTLVHLIAGIFKPWSGMILIDGTPLSNFSASERARLIGVVSQDHFFFQGSIRENLSLWGDAYSNAEIRDALRMACVDDLVTQAPEGLDYRLLEGAINLSGGQRQRLEIARTLLGKPRVLLLDEASNSLDPLVEARIKKNLGQYAATRISVAHRLNTIHDADMIFVLKQGELLDYGSHNELISKESAPFKALFSMSE